MAGEPPCLASTSTTSSRSATAGANRRPRPAAGAEQRIAKQPAKRLFLGQTAVDFWGHRRMYFGVSLLLIVISVLSLSIRELNLGIDFEGGVAFDVPAGEIQRRRRPIDPRRARHRRQPRQDRGARLDAGRHPQGADRGAARRGPGVVAGGVRRRRRRRRRRRQRRRRVVVVGRADHAQGGDRPARVPRCCSPSSSPSASSGAWPWRRSSPCSTTS